MKIQKNIFEPHNDTIKNNSGKLTKTITEPFLRNNQESGNFNNTLLETMKNGGIIASFLMSPLSKTTKPENTSQFTLVKDSDSNRVNDLLIHNTIPITLYNNLLTFRDTGKVFEFKGELLKKITIKNYNVGLASLTDKKQMYDFAKEMYFHVKATGNKSTRDRSLIKMHKSHNIMISASGVSKARFLSTDPNEMCDKLKILFNEKQAGNKSKLIDDEIVPLVGKSLENKCISMEQHKQLLINCNLLHTKKKLT